MEHFSRGFGFSWETISWRKSLCLVGRWGPRVLLSPLAPFLHSTHPTSYVSASRSSSGPQAPRAGASRLGVLLHPALAKHTFEETAFFTRQPSGAGALGRGSVTLSGAQVTSLFALTPAKEGSSCLYKQGPQTPGTLGRGPERLSGCDDVCTRVVSRPLLGPTPTVKQAQGCRWSDLPCFDDSSTEFIFCVARVSVLRQHSKG